MKCPYCDFETSKVVDSRPVEEGNSIRRRRECEGCKRRFTTYEKIEQFNVMVVKKDGTARDALLAPRLTVDETKGRALVIHEGSDNYHSKPDPLGGGGGRIACGVISSK